MAEILKSPGIQMTETDLSFVAGQPIKAGAAIVGPTVKGPVMVPTRVTSYAQFVRAFGTTFDLESENCAGKPIKTSQEFMTSLAVKNYFEEGGDSVIVVRVAADGAFEEGVSTDVIAADGSNPFRIRTISEGLYLNTVAGDTFVSYADTLEAFEKYLAGEEGIGNHQADIQEKYDNWLEQFKNAEYNNYVENFVPSEEDEQPKELEAWWKEAQNTLEYPKTAEDYVAEYGDVDYDEWYQKYKDQIQLSERKDGSLYLGTKDNFSWEITNVDEDNGTFTLLIRRGDDTDKSPILLETWQNLSLDPTSPNYIAAIIGDQHRVYVPAQDDGEDHIEAYVENSGNYTNKSAYVYIEVLNTTPGYILADGTANPDHIEKLPVEQRGGFYGAKGVPGVAYMRNPSDDPEAPAYIEATIGEGEDQKRVTVDFFADIKSTSVYPQGVSLDLYVDALALLENEDEYKFNILSAPGAIGKGDKTVRDLLVSIAETRGDNIAVVDLGECGLNVKQVAEVASQLNTSYAATYWPWLQMYSATGRMEWVPASVVIPGVYAFTDRVAAPWFAPAGMTRGALGNVIQARKKLMKGERDILYKKNVNPIATLPGTGLVVYGQKTLQKKASALDRVNVRRLLIELKENVRNMASKILFEQNSAQVRNGFQAECESYLASVAARQGLYAYSVIVEPINTPESIDRNEFHAQIAIQPTKAIEFIYINFVITATGVEFQDSY